VSEKLNMSTSLSTSLMKLIVGIKLFSKIPMFNAVDILAATVRLNTWTAKRTLICLKGPG